MKRSHPAPLSPRSSPAEHDHRRCIHTALERAEVLCRERGARFTQLRRKVLQMVWEGHTPVGAYDLLRQLTVEGQKAAPPTIYRALDFLLEMGLIHRIESRNAFIGCDRAGKPHCALFFVCDQCGEALELENRLLMATLEKEAGESGFTLTHRTVEARGLCARCKGTSRQ